MIPANFAAAVSPMPSSVARRKSSTFSLLYMRTSSPDRFTVQLSVRTPLYTSVFTAGDYITGVALSKFQYDLSIIIPIYNTEFEFLEKCLESIRDIYHLQFEAILVDHGSQSDYSTALKELVSSETFPLRLIVKENGGQNSARELGLHVSRVRYLLFLDLNITSIPFCSNVLLISQLTLRLRY